METNQNNLSNTGLDLDSLIENIKDGSYTYSLNGKLFKRGNSWFLNNYGSNVLCANFPSGLYPIGGVQTNNPDEWILALVGLVADGNGDYESEIGILKNCEYTTIVNDPCLGFNIRYQIDMAFKENYQCGRVIYFTDNNTHRKYLNIDHLPLLVIGHEEDGCTPIYGGLDCDFIEIDKKFEYPCIDIDIISGAGSLHTGSYFIFFQYADVNGVGLTNVSEGTNRIDIITRGNNYLGAGDKADTVSSKAINIILSGLDTSFTNYNLYVIKDINGILTAQFIVTLPIGTTQYLYNGIETSTEDITLDELIVKSTIYDKFKVVEPTQGFLQWGNITAKREYNFQPYANDIQVQWVSYQIPAVDYYNKNHPYFNMQSLMRDEIIPIGIKLKRDDGSFTCVYHIPGRAINVKSDGSAINLPTDQYGQPIDAPVDTHWDISIEDSGGTANGDVYEGGTLPRWQVYNTATIEGTNSLDGDEGCYQWGEMSYWESTDVYPSNIEVWGDLACQPIRHHKMPDCSITHIHDNLNGSATISEFDNIYLLGIQCLNIIIDPVLFPDIVGYEIVIGDRTYQKSIIAKGLLFDNFEQEEPGGASDPVVPAPYFYTAWAYNDLSNASNFGQTDSALLDNFSFWSPDTTFIKSNIGSAGELKLESEEYGDAQYSSYVYTVPISNVNTGTNIENGINFLGDITFSTGWYNNYVLPTFGGLRRQLDKREYILNNSFQVSSIGNINNLYRESTVMFTTTAAITINSQADTSRSGWGSGVTDGPISSYYCALKQNIPNLWGTIDSVPYQKVYECSIDSTETETGCLIGGDIFISLWSFHKRTLYSVNGVSGVANTNDILSSDGGFGGDGTGGNEPFAMVYGNPYFYCESSVNVEYRYSGPTVKETFYPNLKDGLYQLYQFESPTYMWVDIDNFYLYNTDYSKLNNINSICVQSAGFDPNDCQEKLYDRVIYSERDQTEGLADNWLVYKPNNYWDATKNKGELWDIRNLSGDRILFRFTNGIFLRQLNLTLDINQGEVPVQLGAGTLYNPPPVELFNIDSGYIGTRSQWAFNSTPFGCFMVDDVRGMVLQFGESFNPISNNGLNSWFNDNLRLKLLQFYPDFPHFDNPANPQGIGFISTYDSQNKIWILTKKDYIPLDEDSPPTYSVEDDEFTVDDEPVTLDDPLYFVNKSWTIGYNVLANTWISWYSFIPNGYLQLTDNYLSYPGDDVWIHNSKTNFMSYYGNRSYPFVIEFANKNKESLVTKLNTLYWKTYAMKPSANGDFEYELRDVTFDSGYVYTANQCTGLLVFTNKDPNLPSQSLTYPNVSGTQTNVLISAGDGIWSLSYLWDKISNANTQTPFLTSDWNNAVFQAQYPIDKVIDDSLFNLNKDWFQLKPLKNTWYKTRYFFNNNDVSLSTSLFYNLKNSSIRK